jgi:hypothetical protein
VTGGCVSLAGVRSAAPASSRSPRLSHGGWLLRLRRADTLGVGSSMKRHCGRALRSRRAGQAVLPGELWCRGPRLRRA